jgi:SWI/SNF-related matrix-associated actin-dependent regulator of chromatin subfamily A-like protein 1
MNKTLPPFQQIGSQFLQDHPHALLADEPGLGKTVQAIDAAYKKNFKSVRVICPASVRMNWFQELHECGVSALPWQVWSYNQAVNMAKVPVERTDLLILDECHFLKTRDSQRTQAIFGKDGLAWHSNWIWGLSGSPVLNRPAELYPILKTLAAEVLVPYDSWTTYASRFCGAFFDGYGINTRGASHIDDLSNRLKRFMLRRNKTEVLPELPPKIISRIPLAVADSEKTELDKAETEILNREAFISTTQEKFSQLGDLASLLRITGESKVLATVRFIEELLETEDKVVIFTRHRNVLIRLSNALAKHGPVIYQGGMPDGQKQRAIDVFVSDSDCRVFVANIQAAGTGINGLQKAASSVVFAELSWVPGEMSQAIDRLHRIGQTAETVNVYLLHIPGSLESAVLAVQNAKGSVIGRLMGETAWKT